MQTSDSPPPKFEPSWSESLLPFPLPQDSIQRQVLFALRRMTAHGIRDAHAASMMIGTFGMGFRRPLVLLRGFIAELACISNRRITMSPCCALRMTCDEAAMLGVLAVAASNPACAARHLRDLAGGADISSPLSLAAAFNDALADLGQPLAI